VVAVGGNFSDPLARFGESGQHFKPLAGVLNGWNGEAIGRSEKAV